MLCDWCGTRIKPEEFNLSGYLPTGLTRMHDDCTAACRVANWDFKFSKQQQLRGCLCWSADGGKCRCTGEILARVATELIKIMSIREQELGEDHGESLGEKDRALP